MYFNILQGFFVFCLFFNILLLLLHPLRLAVRVSHSSLCLVPGQFPRFQTAVAWSYKSLLCSTKFKSAWFYTCTPRTLLGFELSSAMDIASCRGNEW